MKNRDMREPYSDMADYRRTQPLNWSLLPKSDRVVSAAGPKGNQSLNE